MGTHAQSVGKWLVWKRKNAWHVVKPGSLIETEYAARTWREAQRYLAWRIAGDPAWRAERKAVAQRLAERNGAA